MRFSGGIYASLQGDGLSSRAPSGKKKKTNSNKGNSDLF